jgi:thiol-disulfide isomerase/thioredoxin
MGKFFAEFVGNLKAGYRGKFSVFFIEMPAKNRQSMAVVSFIGVKMKSLMFVFVSLVASISFARLSDGKVQFKVVKNVLTGEVSPGFHFNKEAPANLVVMDTKKEIDPSKKEEKSLTFALADVGAKSFTANFYVCDDKKTVCEEHVVAMSVKNGKVELLGMGVPVEKVQEKAALKKDGKLEMNAHGFVDNDLEGALALAKQKKQLLIVDYGAPWCPACVRFETEVFGTKEFAKLTKNVVKLYLNADKAANKAFGKDYNIKALPTLLILNAKGEEIYRSLDFKPMTVLAKELTPHLKKTNVNWAKIEEQATKGDKKAQRNLAERAFAMLDYEGACKWYALLGENDSFYATSETSLWAERFEADKALNETKYVEVLNKWIKALPDSYIAMTSRVDLANVYVDNKKEIPADVKAELQKNIELAKSLLASDEKMTKMWKEAATDYAPYYKEEVLAYLISTYGLLGQKDEKTKAIAELRTLLENKTLSADRPGEVLMGLTYFKKVEWTAKEEQWLLDLDKTHPGTYAYPMKLARFYMRNKNYDKALPYADLAVQRGEELRFSNLKTLAEVQKELKQKDAARKSIDTALALPEAKLERYQSVTKSLEEMKKAL